MISFKNPEVDQRVKTMMNEVRPTGNVFFLDWIMNDMYFIKAVI